MSDEIDFKAALLTILNSESAYVNFMDQPGRVILDGSFDSPALIAAIRQLEAEGLCEPQFWERFVPKPA